MEGSNKQHSQDILDEDDDFQEFQEEDWGNDQDEQNNAAMEDVQLWEDNWDDDDIDDDFSMQLRAELEKISKQHTRQ